MTHSRTGLACAVVLFCTLGSLLPSLAAASEIVVRRAPGLSASERADVRADAGVRLERMSAGADTEVVSVPDGRELAALERLNADADVRIAAPNVQLRTKAELGWQLDWQTDADVDALDAWDDAGFQGEDVTIGVVDQSIDATHPDLAGHIGDPVEFVTTDKCTAPPPTDVDDHGTHVAGLITALRNDVGMVGLAPLSSVVPLHAVDNCGGGDLYDVMRAFDYGGSRYPIVTASLATDPTETAAFKQLVDELVTDTVSKYPNTLFVVSAGNEGADVDEPGNEVYPCSNDAPNIICVGMTDTLDRPTCWGNVGKTSVDLFAPGLTLSSTVRGGAYRVKSGTSMSAALVAAAAALIESSNPMTYNAEGLKSALDDSVDRVTGLDTISRFGGRLNAARPLLAPGARLGGGSIGGQWVSCDPDHDGFRGANDDCPSLAGKLRGCPDRDQDGIIDPKDNCPADGNPDQADQDGDGLGDACDGDRDGDGVVPPTDRCATLAAPTSDGCPVIVTPTPTATPPGDGGNRNPAPSPTPGPPPDPAPAAPKVTKLDVKVTPKSCKGRTTCKQAAKVTVKVSRSATVAVKVERKVGRKWRQVTFKSLKASISGKSLTIRGTRGKTLTRGSYRVIATISGHTTLKTFRV
ncbi:S8 family serine peptidase [Solirubrobacter phytolaccae]|uniref:S8 family serine peptidase n=1 Tax=Solirubrobacter phytolaccae TaxID=1404360 RepID=A0A9X3S8S2_9ACTN|nr:S8 family serine peptidase [Solirubrobacter phytolaccae]